MNRLANWLVLSENHVLEMSDLLMMKDVGVEKG
jgi:hypothetical protein